MSVWKSVYSCKLESDEQQFDYDSVFAYSAQFMQQFPAKHSIPQMAQHLFSQTMAPAIFYVYLFNIYLSIN